MKSFLTILALALIALMPAAFADNHAMKDKMKDKMADATMTEVMAKKSNVVVFYSDTCGSCKIMEPKMMEAMGVVNMDKINVVKFDFSNKETIEATKLMATKNNVDAKLQEYGAKTGFALVLDNDGNELAKITKADSSAEIAAKLTAGALNVNAKTMSDKDA